jgi:peptidyl-dipeptidase Dcp
MSLRKTRAKKILTTITALPLFALTLAGAAQASDNGQSARKGSSQMASNTKSPFLLQPWSGPYDGVPAWDKVNADDFPAAFAAAMAASTREFEAMVNNPEPISFENTIVASELSGKEVNRLFSIWGVYTSNLSSDKIRKIEAEWDPKISEFFAKQSLDARYFQRVLFLYQSRSSLNLDAKQMRLLEQTYDNLVRNGALLVGVQKDKVIAVESELAKKFSTFSGKVLADEETYILIEDQAELAGLPDSYVAAIKAAAQSKGKAGWAVANTRSAVQPLLENATNRVLREKVWRAFTKRGENGDANDTGTTISEILKLRQTRAELLGFETHAHYRMANTMAKQPERAMDLMMKVWPAAVARVKEEVADMQAIANADNITIEPWDYRFYAEKVRKAKYDLDQNEIKPYFQLDNMVAALFDMANRLYDFNFIENTGAVSVFEPTVRTFEVTRGGKPVGLFYLDNFARSGKRSGAWMTTYRSQYKLGGENNLVLASNNNNFVKGAGGEPTLISIDDATTLFHEFGHALHYLNYDITWPGLAGTPRDFVEYPSQVNENWLLTPYILNKYAKHYKTGEAIPQALVDKIEASSTFNQGFATVEYLSSAILDMKLHFRTDPVADPAAFEKATLAEIGMPREMVMRHRLPQFNHLFSSDAYSAGYYSYLWSETMDADTWAAFEESGDVWNKDLAGKFRTILLSTGDETDRIEAYRKFRGRDPDVNALLKRRGFPTGEVAQAAE